MPRDCQLNVYNFAAMRAGDRSHYNFLRVDPNNTCNLHCVYCHNDRSDEVLETEALREFFRAKVAGLANLQVGCIMEPTLDKRLADLMLMVGESPAKPTGLFILQTNGILLHRHDQEKMREAGLNWLSVSMDASSAEITKGLRGGTSLDKVVRNVRAFAKAYPTMMVDFVTTVTSANIDQLEELVVMGLDIGARRFTFRELFYYPDNRVVDHSRMPALLLTEGQFTHVVDRIRSRFEGKAELIFVPNEILDASARKMMADSLRRGEIGTPQLHAAN